MKTLLLPLLVVPLLACASAPETDHPSAHEAPAPAHATHWSYEGEGGPENWGKLQAENALCEGGREQSPVNITRTERGGLGKFAIKYFESGLSLVNNGHTIQANYDKGSYIEVDGKRFDLVQFHFHTPSEEMINYKAYPMVAHLVHKSADGKLAVIAVLLTEGSSNPMLERILSRLPREEGEQRSYAMVSINLADFLPKQRAYYLLMGSLTTPPCSEGVTWIVMKAPVEMSWPQISQFRELFPMNARPVQPLNHRVVVESK